MKRAFTLAEILITLGVIGVVAAMIMPTLIQNYQKQVTVNRLKHTYSLIYQAVRMSEADNDVLANWDIPNVTSYNANVYSNGKIFFGQYLKPYIKVVKECDYLSADCWADEYIKADGNIENTKISASKNYTYGVVLVNGAVLGFWPRGNFVEIYIDLNGKKGPNKIGRDVFDIIISKISKNDQYGNYNKSGVYFYGQGLTRTQLTTGKLGCAKNAITEIAGIYCGALIMHDGWKIEKGYPW